MLKPRWIFISALSVLIVAAAAKADPKTHPLHVEGAISAVDTTANPPTVTIDGESSSVTLKVTAATRIEVGGEEDDQTGTLADLQVGLDAEAKYDGATNNALQI